MSSERREPMRSAASILAFVFLVLPLACGGGSSGGSSSTAQSGGTSGGGSDTAPGGGGGTEGGGSGGGGTVSDSSYPAAAEDCVRIINEYRATLGLPAYQRWAGDEECADGQAKSDSETSTPHSSFGRCGEMAQNECPGWSGSPGTMIGSCLQMMWAEGPGSDFSAHGHYINMSSTSYTKVACGFYVTPGGRVWSVQDFR